MHCPLYSSSIDFLEVVMAGHCVSFFLKQFWYLLTLLAILQLFITFATVVSNSLLDSYNGLHAVSFAAVYALFFLIWFVYNSYFIVIKSQLTKPLFLGFLIGLGQ